MRAQTLYELRDGTQVNAIFNPDGLRSFQPEWKRSEIARVDGVPVRVLPLARVIASKRASGRDKDLAVLPILARTLRLAACLKKSVPAAAPRQAPRTGEPKRRR